MLLDQKTEKMVRWFLMGLVAVTVIAISAALLKGCGKQATLNEVTIETHETERQQIETDNKLKNDHSKLSDAAIAKRLRATCRDCDQPSVGSAGVQRDQYIDTRPLHRGDESADRRTQYSFPEPQSAPVEMRTEICTTRWDFDENGNIVQKEICR